MFIRHAVFVALVLAACNDGADEPAEPETIIDQSGAVFGWECDADSCTITRVDGSPPPPDGMCGTLKPAYSYSWGSIIEISAVCADAEGWVSLPGWGRFVVCEADADCPTVVSSGGADDYVCHAGFCRSVDSMAFFDELPNRWMMESLCFGERPRFEEFDDDALWAAIETACPGESINDPCNSIPNGCVDPRG